MNTGKSSYTPAFAGIITAIAASLCCITPILALLAGTSGLAAAFSWVEPFRPYLVSLTLLILGIAWYQQLRPKAQEALECACDENEKVSFWQSGKFLGIVTVFALLMLAFPYYSSIFYPENTPISTFAMTEGLEEITLDVRGMTCAGCEQHIEHALGQLEGVRAVKASYNSSTATVQFSPSVVSDQKIINAINETGYQVMNESKNMAVVVNSEDIDFFNVPLVCNAVPSIGCGSRAKPVLTDFEKDSWVKEAWINRSGNTIAIVWEKGTDVTAKHRVVSRVFEKHQVNAGELTADKYLDALTSFNQGDKWLKGDAVDQLSKEEAATLADQLIQAIKNKTTLTPEIEKKLHQKATDSFYELFINFETLSELGDPEVYQAILKEFNSDGENLLGVGNMPSVDALWNSCSNAAKSCSHEGCTSSCGAPKKS